MDKASPDPGYHPYIFPESKLIDHEREKLGVGGGGRVEDREREHNLFESILHL